MAFRAQPALGDSTSDRLHRDHDLLGESIGLVGYDPVSYFPEGGGRPAKGLISITAEHAGVTYRFATEEHKAAFRRSPANLETRALFLENADVLLEKADANWAILSK